MQTEKQLRLEAYLTLRDVPHRKDDGAGDIDYKKADEFIDWLIKRSFAHRDEHWREKLLGLPADTADNIVDGGFGQAIIVSKEDIKALFKDKETEV